MQEEKTGAVDNLWLHANWLSLSNTQYASKSRLEGHQDIAIKCSAILLSFTITP